MFHTRTLADRPSHRVWRIVCIAIIAGLLTACADDSAEMDDRRFANQPSTELPTEATPTEQAPATAPPTPAPEASPESLLDVQGAPGIVYPLLKGSIEVIDATGAVPSVRIVPPESQRFVALASSPDGDRVAALIMPAGESSPEAATVAVYDAQGQLLHQWSNLADAGQEGATPVAGDSEEAAVEGSISWAPQGDRLLVTLAGSILVSIALDGEPSLITVPAPVGRVVDARWSPQDDRIALLARDLEGSGVIWVFDPYVDGESLRQVAPPNADASNLGSVTRFAWTPDGTSIAFILAEESGSSPSGGQLYTINLSLGVRLLVATPGRGGPAAEIVEFAVSPDGGVIAYTIAIPDSDGWQFHSLWVRSITSAGLYDVPVDNVELVDQVWWAGSGIVWRQQSGEFIDIVTVAPPSAPETLFTLAPGTAGTPVASPIATPIAASPAQAATPVAATPEPPDEATPAVATPAA
ncbi:MAG: PD40 domain-containing protein [Chloroflexia bacterium]|nr:PD40 domain-containing protein [Chloroflexia bacterium]